MEMQGQCALAPTSHSLTSTTSTSSNLTALRGGSDAATLSSLPLIGVDERLLALLPASPFAKRPRRKKPRYGLPVGVGGAVDDATVDPDAVSNVLTDDFGDAVEGFFMAEREGGGGRGGVSREVT